jgi:hypothetical protein
LQVAERYRFRLIAPRTRGMRLIFAWLVLSVPASLLVSRMFARQAPALVRVRPPRTPHS